MLTSHRRKNNVLVEAEGDPHVVPERGLDEGRHRDGIVGIKENDAHMYARGVEVGEVVGSKPDIPSGGHGDSLPGTVTQATPLGMGRVNKKGQEGNEKQRGEVEGVVLRGNLRGDGDPCRSLT